MKRLVLSSICLVVLVCGANADVLYNNLTSPTFRGDEVNSTTGLGPLFNSFSTGPGGFFLELNRVGVLLSGDPTTLGSVNIDLVSFPAGAPLLHLGTVTDSQLPPTGFAQFFFPAAFTLAPGRRYYIEISEVSVSPITSAQWAFSADQTAVGVLNNYFANFNGTFLNFSVPDAFPYQMEVDVTQGAPVPEPGSFLLLGSGVLGLIGAVRKRLLT